MIKYQHHKDLLIFLNNFICFVMRVY